jgi:hypothetical protein
VRRTSSRPLIIVALLVPSLLMMSRRRTSVTGILTPLSRSRRRCVVARTAVSSLLAVPCVVLSLRRGSCVLVVRVVRGVGLLVWTRAWVVLVLWGLLLVVLRGLAVVAWGASSVLALLVAGLALWGIAVLALRLV